MKESDVLEARLVEIYTLANAKVAEMAAIYTVRGLEPGEYVQKLPTFDTLADFTLFQDAGSFGPEVSKMTYPEYIAYLTAIQSILKSKGYGSELVPLTQMRFIDYLEKQEENHGGQ